MASVTQEQVRDRFDLTDIDVSDSKVDEFVDEAAVIIGDKIGKTLDDTDCTSREAIAIADLASLYCFCKVTGGSAIGLSFSVGGVSVSAMKSQQFDFILERLKDFLKTKKEITFIVAQDDGDLS